MAKKTGGPRTKVKDLNVQKKGDTIKGGVKAKFK